MSTKNSTQPNKRETGTRYEEQAAAYLRSLGYRILTHSFRCRLGEIDLVAEDHATLVFVEVKYRKDASSGHALEAVDLHKQQRICRVADYYRVRYRVPEDKNCRFDVVGVMGGQYTLIKNAFPYQTQNNW